MGVVDAIEGYIQTSVEENEIPAGSQEKFVYSNEEISATGNKIKISTGSGLSDTSVLLKSNEVEETGYVAEYLTPGMPVELDAQKGAWYKIGISM